MKNKLIVMSIVLLIILSGCNFNLKSNIEGSKKDPSNTTVASFEDEKDSLDMTKLLDSIKDHLDNSDYIIISADSYDYKGSVDNNHKSHMEMLIDRENKVSCILTESGLGYFDYNTSTSYLTNEDSTSFYRLPNNNSISISIEDNFRMMFNDFYNVNTEFTLDEITVDNNGIKVANISNIYKVENSDSYYRLSIVANADTGEPYSIDVCHIEKEATVETSDGTITGTDFISARNYYLISIIDENSEEFSMFKSATQLPSDDECIELTE